MVQFLYCNAYVSRELLLGQGLPVFSKAMFHLKGKPGHIDFLIPKCCPSDKGFQCSALNDVDAEKGENDSLTIEELQSEELALDNQQQRRRSEREGPRLWRG